jgi:hypothetical protein
MWTVVRSILAVLAGFVAATVVMLTFESINGHVLYPELGRMAEGVTDPAAIRAVMASAPLGAFLVVLLGWALGGLLGGLVAARIGSNAPLAHALVLGAVLTLAGIANNMMIPPPLWFWVVSVLLFLPAAFVGARLAPSRSQARI